jgi:hypothetical protein
MRRFLSILRKPVVLLVLTFLALIGAFWCFLPYQPQFEFKALQPDEPAQPFSTGIDSVADDGNEVIACNRFEWESCGTAITIAKWNARQRKMITSKRNFDSQMRRVPPLSETGSNPEADEIPERYMDLLFVHGESMPAWLILEDATWEALHQMLLESRSKCMAVQKEFFKSLWKKEYGSIEVLTWDLFPERFSFSPDRRLLGYGTHDGVAVHRVIAPDGIGWWVNGVAVDEWQTRRRIALLPMDAGRLFADIVISPNGRTAVVTTLSDAKINPLDYEEPQLDIWDLATSQLLVQLRTPTAMENKLYCKGVRFSPGGDIVFYQSKNQVAWWDAATGELRGWVAGARDIAILEGGRLLVTCGDEAEDHTLRFWDTKSGKQLATKNLANALSYSEPIHVQSFTENSRYVAFSKFHPSDTAPPPTKFEKWLNRLIPSRKSNKPEGILVFDGIDRREVANLPGRTATFSPNGRWLATIDGDGIVRVWELPLRRPWLRIFGYAAITTLACTLLYLLVRWPFRRMSARFWN